MKKETGRDAGGWDWTVHGEERRRGVQGENKGVISFSIPRRKGARYGTGQKTLK